mgnify:CR=1 FL=1
MVRAADRYAFTPTEAIARNAARGLELRRRFGRGGTEAGLARARDLKNRHHLLPTTIKQMHAYFARHKIDKRSKDWGNEENPSAAYIAWLLWGGDEGRDWAEEKRRTLDS